MTARHLRVFVVLTLLSWVATVAAAIVAFALIRRILEVLSP